MKDTSSEWLYLGVDVGGTKVQASVVRESGEILTRKRQATPRNVDPGSELEAIESAIEAALLAARRKIKDVQAIGIAIPGVVVPKDGHIVVTPNMSLGGVGIGKHLQRRFGVPVAVGNDCNLGALGERWLGAARAARSVFAILVGTGVGGGFVRKGKLWRGARESASEIGHIVMQIGGPECGCGNRGCLEALASRTAIERDIRQAIGEGRPSVVSELTNGDLDVIRSRVLRKALDANDAVVTEVMTRAAEVLGHACLTVRHLVDPEIIVLGGGVIEACGDFVVPIIRRIVAADGLAGAREGGQVVVSELGDDAVVLGAVALARGTVGRSPFRKQLCEAT
ncbi:MAG: ROK family protein [Patescibacteria group bacterium]|nr:ROK family protein [Patescibacteria group bacterium]